MKPVIFLQPKKEVLYQYAKACIPNNDLLRHIKTAENKEITALLYFNEQDALHLSVADKQCNNETISINFSTGKSHHRLLFGGGKQQPITKACGLIKHKNWTILDATAGLAQDAFVIASLMSQSSITLIEQHPAIFSLIQYAIQQPTDNPAIQNICNKMSVINDDSIIFMDTHKKQFDVIYLDPMYPERKKKAKVKKGMQALQTLIGHEQNETTLFESAIASAKQRVVIKRPKSAPFYTNTQPSFDCSSKNTRYDVYVCN